MVSRRMVGKGAQRDCGKSAACGAPLPTLRTLMPCRREFCRAPSSSGTGPGRGLEFILEFLQFAGVDVADSPEIEALLRPELDVESLHGPELRAVPEARTLRDEEIDHVVAPAVHDGRDRPPIDIVEPAADERE